MNYKAVVFDLDGTLLDTIDDLADSMNLVLERFGFPQHDVEKYKYFVGEGIEKLARNALPPDVCDEEAIHACVQAMREEYGNRWAEKTKPYDGAIELLKGLQNKNIKIAILSNKPHDFTLLTVNKFFSEIRFDMILGARPGIPKKPEPEAALEIAETLGLHPSECLYLGDTSTDMLTATNAGMYPIGALWGFRKADELEAHGAKVLIQTPEELLKLL